ncbi:MAG: hypothetical protein AAF591_22270 [Verrucomicrobiota bacterium]
MTNKPEQTFRLGAVKATIWKNQGKNDQPFYSVSIARVYKQGDSWKETTSFGKDDLPKLGLVAEEAYRFILSNSLHSDES